MAWLYVLLVVVPVATLVGYAIGRWHEREAAAERAERLSRIDPGSRTPGLPTNTDSEPATVRKARLRH